MAGNIPPLVSSTPPPLNAFDDEEEEEEDEFGLYNTAEEIDYNECNSFEEKDKQKQNVSKSRGEQDSTSQDSATDSGLCPDSEGMSPTPHSDDERTLKQNISDKLCKSSGELSDSQGIATENFATDASYKLLNGHAEGGGEKESSDNFGNFEFASSLRVDVDTEREESVGEDVLRSLSTSDRQQHNEKEHNVDRLPNIHLCDKELVESSEKPILEFRPSESSINGYEDENCTQAKVDTCKYVHSNSQLNEFSAENKDNACSNDGSSSVDSSLALKTASSSPFPEIEQFDHVYCLEKTQKEDNSVPITPNMESDSIEQTENEIPNEIDDEDEFDDFTDFKAGFSGYNDLSKPEHSEKSMEHSNTLEDETRLYEAALPLTPSNQEDKDDEFSNFADFSSSDCMFVSAQSSNSSENFSQFPLKVDNADSRTESEFQDWVSVFPFEDEESSLVTEGLLRQDDVVWSRLFPLESSPAICYQWNESLANRCLLTALNIDSRNILLTPWSLSAVPRFAANLSCGPLEPIKASETQVISPSPSVAATITAITTATTTITDTATVTTQESVPDAHFDWVGSGLTNPLDSSHNSLLDLNFIITIESQLATSMKTVLNLPKTPSAKAETLLASLPDISFMRKTYIDFPINKV